MANRHEVFGVFETFVVARLRRAGDPQTCWLRVRSAMPARLSGAVLKRCWSVGGVSGHVAHALYLPNIYIGLVPTGTILSKRESSFQNPVPRVNNINALHEW